MDEMLQQILAELKSLKSDVAGIKDGQERLEEDVAWLKTDVNGLKEGQERLETKMDNLVLELRNSYKYTNEKMEEHRNAFENTARELKIVKIDIDYLSSKTGIHDTKINRILSNIKA